MCVCVCVFLGGDVWGRGETGEGGLFQGRGFKGACLGRGVGGEEGNEYGEVDETGLCLCRTAVGMGICVRIWVRKGGVGPSA